MIVNPHVVDVYTSYKTQKNNLFILF